MRRGPVLAGFALVLALATSGTVAPVERSTVSLDRLGWEGGYAHDDPLAVEGEELTVGEREAMISRAMARIEYLRGLEFRERVPVTVINRTEYRRSRGNDSTDPVHSRWNNQVWKALFLVGADRDVSQVLNETYGSSVLGYYSPSREEIVIVSDSARPTISRGTLVHELVHALQDQHFGLGASPATQDGQLARNGVIEGEANRIQDQYDGRCGSTWGCVTITGGGGGGGGSTGQYVGNVLLVVVQPYVTGPDFVAAIEARAGRPGLNDLYGDLPESTEQIIHPAGYPDDRPVNVTVPDRSAGDWRRFDHEPVADTAGEASIFAMVHVHALGTERSARYSYRHPVSEGWGGDAIVPYTDGDRGGYVWETAWDSSEDAREFHEAYLELLDQEGAVAIGADRFRFPSDSPWRGAYRVVRDGKRVRIVHGPTVSSLDGIHRP